MDIILMKDSMVISDMFTFCNISILNFIPILIVQHLRLDYRENFELAWKKTIDKLKWNMCVFLKILSCS